MNQTLPPNPSESGQDDPQAPPPQEYANPYYNGAQRPAEPAPNLDQGSPVLTAAETRRMNRKALLFLGGIVLLLLLLGYFMLKGGRNAGDDSKPKADAGKPLVVPELPSVGEDPNANAPPIGLAQTDPQAGVPPLPETTPAPAWSGGYGPAPAETGTRPPSLLERRMTAASGNTVAGTSAAPEAGGANLAAAQMQALQNAMLGLQPGGTPAPTVAKAETSAQFMSNPNALLVRGTYLRCVLETRIVTDVPGYTSCIVTEPVYSVNGRQVLLPKGSKILGSYEDQGKDIARVAVVWDRVITPNGIDVTMSSPGVDGLGGAGHPGDYNGHWGSRIASALLISLISDAFQWGAAEHGPRTSTSIVGPGGTTVVDQPFESATARTVERLANQAVEKSAQRKGTVTINQGTVVNVYVAQDVDFSAVMALR